MKHKLLTLFLALSAGVGSLFAETYSGTCGTDLYWSLDTSTGVLSITGTGTTMEDFNVSPSIIPIPWVFNRADIKTISLPSTLQSIGSNAFYDCTNLTSVIIPQNLTSIGSNAFDNCRNLTSIELPNSLISIGEYAFASCVSLTSIELPNSVTSIGYKAFSGCTGLTSIEIPNSVTSIGSHVFSSCSNLTSITIGNGIKDLNNGDFDGCSNLTKVMLNSNALVSQIHYVHFTINEIFGRQVEEYILGENITKIGEYAFFGGNLKSIVIPNSVTSIEDHAFKNCFSLTSIELPNSVTSIGYNAFSGCTGLTSIEIPGSVTNIGISAFSYCTNLTSVTIGNSVAMIGVEAFRGCSRLVSIEIPNSVTSIGSTTFKDCTSLTSVTIGNGLKDISSTAFDGCNSLTKVALNSNAIVSKIYTMYSSIVDLFGSQVEEYILGENVAEIGEYAFYGSDLKSITIPNSVISIGGHAFSNCNNLTSVTIPESVTNIGSSAFSYCTNLTSINIPNSVTSIGDYVFNECFSLTSIEISNSLVNIGENAFYNCRNLTSIELPNSLISIGEYAFESCVSLTSIELPNSVTSIGHYAFNDCSSLNSVTIGDGITSIGDYGLKNCSSLTSITIGSNVKQIEKEVFSGCDNLVTVAINSNHIVSKNYVIDEYGETYNLMNIFGSQVKQYIIGNGITSIGNAAFYNCYKMTSVTIPGSVTSIGDYAFSACDKLTSIDIPNSVTSVGEGAFSGCSSLKQPIYNDYVFAYMPISHSGSYTIPNGIKSIAGGAFVDCSSITHIEIPNSVTDIGEAAFIYCSGLSSVIISKSVTTIGNYAFYDCSTLTTIHAQMENPPSIEASVFEECGDLSKINCYVPQGSLELYQNAAVWKEFNIIAVNNDNSYTLTVSANDPLFGNVTGSGEYAAGLEVELTATPNAGYHFVCWNDGNQSATRTVTVSSDATYTALFAADVVAQEEVVTVYAEQTTATITAELIDNDDVESYRFVIYYQGAVFCTCLLDKDGQTLQVDYADNEPNSIPTRLNMPAQALNEANGLNISVSDLQRCATYQFTLDALDADGNILDRRENDFTTTGSVETTDGITVWEDELPFIWEGITFTTAGTETKTLTASTGCDSIVTFTLNVKYHDITLQDNADPDYYTQFAEDYNGHTVNTATLNRQFTQDKWSTLCLPFNVSKSLMIALGLSGRVYEFRYAEQSDDESIQMYFASAQSIEAGKGYIVNANAKLAQKTSFVFPNVTIHTDADNGDITALTGYNDNSGRGNLYLAGTLRAGVLQGSANGNTYLGLKDNKLYYPNSTSGTAIRAYRGFFRISEPMTAQRVRIVLDGEGMGELIIDNGQLTMDNEQPVRKYIENGIIYIRSNGQTYNAQGLRID